MKGFTDLSLAVSAHGTVLTDGQCLLFINVNETPVCEVDQDFLIFMFTDKQYLREKNGLMVNFNVRYFLTFYFYFMLVLHCR